MVKLKSANLLTLMNEFCSRLSRMLSYSSATGRLLSCSFAFEFIVLIETSRSMTCLFDGIAVGMRLLVFCLKWDIVAEFMKSVVSELLSVSSSRDVGCRIAHELLCI